MEILIGSIADQQADATTHLAALKVLEQLFTCQADKYTEQFEILGGTEDLESLQYSPFIEVANCAADLIEKFWDGQPIDGTTA